MLVETENCSSSSDKVDDASMMRDCNISTDLYGDLQNTAMMFSHLAHRLQDNFLKQKSKSEKGIQTDGCCENTRKTLMDCQAENLRLQKKLKDVSDVNRRWQNYNVKRQKLVRHLQVSLFELRRHTGTQNTGIKVTTDNVIYATDGSSKILDNRPKSEGPKRATFYEELLNENESLTQSLSNTRRMMIALEQQLEECKEDRDILRIQLKTCKDDWEVEREEKNEALSKVRKVTKNWKENVQRLRRMKNGVSCSCNKPDLVCRIQPLECDGLADKTRKRSSSIVCSVDGMQIHLRERNFGELVNLDATHSSENVILENNSCTVSDPIVTFPESNSSGSNSNSLIQQELNVALLTPIYLVCPTCAHHSKNESQFLDHYIDCENCLDEFNS